MNAAQFIPAFAAALGVPETELRTVDRALTEAGLREKSVGRSRPEVTRAEAVRLLIGYCRSTKLTEAAEVVRDLSEFKGQEQGQADETFCRAAFRFTPNDAMRMNLVNAIERLCGWLASADAPDEHCYVGLEIPASGQVTLQAFDRDARKEAEIAFVGAYDLVGEPGVETVRIVRRRALRWIGENTQVAD